ncbi:MAG TPA: pitrilysin family protein [Chloroflexota bacterium]
MDETREFLTERLDSGIQVVGQPMAGVESAALGFLFGAGARDETPDAYGVTHLVEQMLFRGTETMDVRQISETFDSLGVSYDSSAGVEMTLVSAVLIGNRLPPALELLAACVRSPSFPRDLLDSAKALQIQELRQREDRPAQRVMEELRRHFFAGSPIAHDVLGTEPTIASMSREVLVDYWRSRYTASNMLISVAGNFDWQAVISQLQTLTAGWPVGTGRSRIETPQPHAGVTVIMKDATQENIGFAFPAVSVADPRYYVAALVAQALGGSSHSRLFQEVREKRGLAYAVQARYDGLEMTGMTRVYVGTSAERAHESVEVVLDELRNLEAAGLTEDELRLSKTRLKSQLVMRSESTLARMASNLRSWWFEGQLHSLDEVRERIDAVTLDEVAEFVQTLGITQNLAAVALGPRSEDELFGGVLARS